MERYDIQRVQQSLHRGAVVPFFGDEAQVLPGTQYDYDIYAIDHHFNYSAPTRVTVVTPPAGSLDPIQIGVRPNGTYWGAAGEQIDLRSGNLNYSIPLVRAQGPNGTAVTFALSYNSQMWRKDAGGTWFKGRDTGYGLGWHLLAGSLEAYQSHNWTISHYNFRDASGAVYKLEPVPNTSNLWRSREEVYIEYDSVSQRLYFPDGTYWWFTCVSAGDEEDAGTLYPTRFYDTNGNAIQASYHPGRGLPWTDSSGRLAGVTDIRTVGTSMSPWSIENEAGSTSRIGRISTTMPTTEKYTFAYLQNQPVTDPFAGASYGAAHLLQSLTAADGRVYTFAYQPATGELTGVSFTGGGSLAWTYRSMQYAANRTVREVYQRTLVSKSGDTPGTHTIDHPQDSSRYIRNYVLIYPPDAGKTQAWYFYDSSQGFKAGLLQWHQMRDAAGTPRRHVSTDWTQHATTGRVYLSGVATQLNGSWVSQVNNVRDEWAMSRWRFTTRTP